jgi:hypothetical protein
MDPVLSCFHVFPDGDGWAVAFNGNPPHHSYSKYAKALAAARDAALARWQIFGIPTRVVVREIDGKVFDDMSYEAPASQPDVDDQSGA